MLENIKNILQIIILAVLALMLVLLVDELIFNGVFFEFLSHL